MSQESEQAQEAWRQRIADNSLAYFHDDNHIQCSLVTMADYKAALKYEIERMLPDPHVHTRYFQGQLAALENVLSLLDTVKPL